MFWFSIIFSKGLFPVAPRRSIYSTNFAVFLQPSMEQWLRAHKRLWPLNVTFSWYFEPWAHSGTRHCLLCTALSIPLSGTRKAHSTLHPSPRRAHWVPSHGRQCPCSLLLTSQRRNLPLPGPWQSVTGQQTLLKEVTPVLWVAGAQYLPDLPTALWFME